MRESHIQTSEGRSQSGEPASLEEIQDLFGEATTDEERLSLLKGFKLKSAKNADSHKVFFSVGCDCGTVALLSVEVLKSKTLAQFKEALPALVGHLHTRVQQFTTMTCDLHARMRTGGFGRDPD